MNKNIRLLFLYILTGVILIMAIVIPTSKMLRTPTIDLVNNNAIDELQFDLDKQITQTITLREMNSITYAKDKGLFVAVGSSSVAYSTDGRNFTNGTIPSGAWRGITYAEDKGLFVAVGEITEENIPKTNATAYSYDGITFTKGTSPNGIWESITYAKDKGLFVTVSYHTVFGTISNYVAYSTDGINFIGGTITKSEYWSSVTYAEDKGLFVAVGERGVTAYSTDGRTFTNGTIASGNWRSITYAKDKGLFVAVGLTVAYSTDGRTFTNGTIANIIWRGITYAEDKGLFVAVGYSARTSYSTDGRNFTNGTIPSGNWEDLIYGNDLFVAVGSSSVAYSTDGVKFLNIKISSVQTFIVYRMKDRNDNPFKIDGNELLTTNAQYQTSDGRGLIPMTEHIATQTVNKWMDGRMTASVETYYTEFLDESGKVVYTGKDGNFPTINDEIILWDLATNESYIKNPDGSARKFKITSSEFSLSGIARINIKALEVW